MMRFVCATLLFAVAAFLVADPPARATPLPNPDRIVALSVVDQELGEVLGELGSQAGFRVSVSPAVHGRVHGRLPAVPAAAFLDHLAGMFGFEWYFDGETLYASAYSESASRLLVLGAIDAVQLSRTLDQLGIADARWPIRVAGDAGIGLAQGPPRYLALVEQTLAALPRKSVPSDAVRIFRGSAASSSL